MIAVIQRVERAELSADGETKASIGYGLAVYVGVEQSDCEADIVSMCKKVSTMRIFSDNDGKMNLSVIDVGGEILMVPNFTLCADIAHGNRPSFTNAMRPPTAKIMFDYCVDVMTDMFREHDLGDNVKCGIFGADMTINQVNIGPITIIYR